MFGVLAIPLVCGTWGRRLAPHTLAHWTACGQLAHGATLLVVLFVEAGWWRDALIATVSVGAFCVRDATATVERLVDPFALAALQGASICRALMRRWRKVDDDESSDDE